LEQSLSAPNLRPLAWNSRANESVILAIKKGKRKAKMNAWLESSAAERRLSGKVIPILLAASMSESEICTLLEGLPNAILKGNHHESRFDDTIVRVLNAVPELRQINFASAFPLSDSDLTANVIGRISQEVSIQFHDPAVDGVVATPHILAQDMVNVSAAAWLSEKLGIDLKTTTRLISSPELCPVELAEEFRHALSATTWWDPCVGAGVFPICILKLAAKWEIDLLSVAQHISGADLNPLAVSATKTRMTLALASLGVNVGVNSRALEGIETADSLKSASEQPTMYGRNLRSFDIVIGNPPYVRADRLSGELKASLRSSFPSIATGTADLYNYFIALGLSALNQTGVLCFISPATFQKSRYGRTTRLCVSRSGAVRALFDFDELPVFEGAGVHPSVYIVAKGHPQGEFIGVSFTELPESEPLTKGIAGADWMPPVSISAEGWRLATATDQDILSLMRKDSLPLSKYSGGILSGIKTGKKEAYLLSKSQAEPLLQDDSSRSFLRPLVRPVDVRRWHVDWDGTQLLLIRFGESVPDSSQLMAHLRSHEHELRRRQDVQGHPTWYGLRACTYYERFDSPKILFPDIAYGCRFVMDTEGFYVPDGAFLIPTEDYFLLGLLNSRLADFFFRASCTSIGNAQHDGRIRFKKAYVEHFPVRVISESNRHLARRIEMIARELSRSGASQAAEREIDELVLELYGIPGHLWPKILRLELANV
jgi:hypothetical protein